MSKPILDFNRRNETSLEILNKYYENSYLIVIGINKYKEELSLKNAENDAKGIMNVLRHKYGFKVMRSLFNEEATRERIWEIFDHLILDESRIRSRDRVIIYYSGHGKLRRLIRSGSEHKVGYIVPYDSKIERYDTYISMSEIIDRFQLCPAKHVLLILDCCYSGYAARGNILLPQKPPTVTEKYIKEISSRPAKQVLAAGEEDQPVNDSGIRPGYSAFTGALLDILETETDLDKDGILTANEIGFNLVKLVALEQRTGAVFQKPVYTHIGGSQGGDLI